MRRLGQSFVLCGVVLSLCPGCAHFLPTNLEDWGRDKAARMTECLAKGITDRHEFETCMATYAANLGSDACDLMEKHLADLDKASKTD